MIKVQEITALYRTPALRFTLATTNLCVITKKSLETEAGAGPNSLALALLVPLHHTTAQLSVPVS